MPSAYEGLVVEFGADTSEVGAALRSLSSEAKKTTKELNNIKRALKYSPGSTQLLELEQRQFRRSLDDTREKLAVLKKALAQGTAANLPDEEFDRLNREIIEAESQLKHFQKQMKTATVEFEASKHPLYQVGTTLEQSSAKFNKIGSGVQTIGRGLTYTMTPALIAVGAASIGAAVTIDSALTSVRKTVDGTEAQYQELQDAAIEFSKVNAVPADQILNIQALGAQLGFSIDELQNFGEVVSGLDIATNMDAETAATEMAQFANITKLSHDEVSNYASAIVGLGNNFATTESDISAMAMRLAASGTQVGMTQADILGIATALASMGVEAEAGGTAISTIMAQIDKDIALSGAVMSGTSDLTQAETEKVSAALETWASTAGLTAQEFADAWTSNPVEALTTLLSNMESATAEGGNMSVMLQDLGIDAIRQSDVMKRLAGNSDFVTEAVAKSNEEWEKNTALTREVENKNNSLESKFQMLQNRVAAIGVEIGGTLADALLEAVEAAEPLFEAIEKGAEAFTSMDKESQQLIITIGAVGIALGPLLTLFGGVIRNGGAIGTALKGAATGVSRFHVAMDNMSAAATVGKGNLTGVTASIGGAASKSVVAATAVSGVGKAFSALSSAGGLAAISLAAVVAGFVFDQWQQYQQHLDNVEGATTGLSTATDSFKGAYDGAKSAVEGGSGALENYQSDLEGVLKKQSELADKITETWTKLGTDSGMLDGYMQTIDTLAEKTGLSKEEQDKLAIAVAGVNEVCGTSYSVIDAQNGILNTNKDAIMATVDAWKANAMAQAAQEEMVELARNQITLENEQKAALEGVDKAKRQLDDALANPSLPIETTAEYSRQLDIAKGKLHDADGAVLGNKASMQDLEKEYLSSQDALSRTSASIQAWISSNSGWTEALGTAGIDIGAFSQSLSECGISTQQLATLAPEQLASLVSAWDGSTASVKGLVTDMKTSIENDAAAATRDATLAVTEGIPAFSGAVLSMKDGASAMLNPITGEWSVIGNAAMLELANSMAQSLPVVDAAAFNVATSANGGIADLPSDYGGTGDLSAANLANGLTNGSGNVQGAAAVLVQVANGEVVAMPAEMYNQGVAGGQNLAGGMDTAAGTVQGSVVGLVDAVTGEMIPLTDALTKQGTEGGVGYASGMSDTAGQTQSAADEHAQATESMKSNAGNSFTWGAHQGQNYADGLRSKVRAVNGASLSLADAAAGPLKHTTPDEGPLQDDDQWGGHMGDNLVNGLLGKVPELRAASTRAANALALPIKDGAYQAVETLESYGYKVSELADRVDSYATKATSAFKGMYRDWDKCWEKAKPNLEQNTLVMSAWAYDLEQTFNRAGVQFNEYFVNEVMRGGVDEYGLLIAEMSWRTDAEVQEIINAFGEAGKMSQAAAEAERVWLMTNGEVKASLDELSQWNGLFELKTELMQSVKAATDWGDSLSNVFGRAGIEFNEEFMDQILKGDKDFISSVEKMADISDENLQSIVDSYASVTKADREATLKARQGYLEYLRKVDLSDTTSEMETLEDKVYDVSVAFYSDKGFAAAMDRAEMSVYDLGASLTNAGIDLDAFKERVQSTVDSVSNGFDALSRESQTSLSDFTANLKNNMTEMGDYTDRITNVFGRLGDFEGLDEFKEAVAKGGYDQWGQIMRDLSGKTDKELKDFVKLYNESISSAQTAAFDQLFAMNPGSELVKKYYDGIAEAKELPIDELKRMTNVMSSNMKETADDAYGQGYQVGENIAKGIKASLPLIEAAAAAARAAAEIGSSSGSYIDVDTITKAQNRREQQAVRGQVK